MSTTTDKGVPQKTFYEPAPASNQDSNPYQSKPSSHQEERNKLTQNEYEQTGNKGNSL